MLLLTWLKFAWCITYAYSVDSAFSDDQYFIFQRRECKLNWREYFVERDGDGNQFTECSVQAGEVCCSICRLAFAFQSNEKGAKNNSRFITVSMALPENRYTWYLLQADWKAFAYFSVSWTGNPLHSWHNHINHFTENMEANFLFLLIFPHRCNKLQARSPSRPSPNNRTICVRLCDEKLNIDYLHAIPDRPVWAFMCTKSVLIIIIFSSLSRRNQFQYLHLINWQQKEMETSFRKMQFRDLLAESLF